MDTLYVTVSGATVKLKTVTNLRHMLLMLS